MGDFVVGHGEGAAGEEIRIGHALDRLAAEESGLAQGAVREYRAAGHGADGVIAIDQHVIIAVAGGVDESGEHRFHGLKGLVGFGMVGSVALQVVVEVRQVGEQEVGRLLVQQGAEGVDDPFAGAASGQRAPVAHQVEGAADGLAKLGFEVGGFGVEGLDHAAAMFVDGARRDDQVGLFAEALLPEGEADASALLAEGIPDAGAGDEAGGLFPEEDFFEARLEDAVGDHAVRDGMRAGAEVGLSGTGEGREGGTGGGEGEVELQALGQLGAEGGDLDDQQFGHR